MDKIKRLEADSIKLIRSIPQISGRPAQLWSTGKDSTLLLYLVRKAFHGRVPWPVIHIDTGKKPREVYEFRQRLKIQWEIPLRVIKNEEAIRLGIGPDRLTRYKCCSLLKTKALKQELARGGLDAIILAIRHDEHYVRGMEDLLSLRDEEGNWRWWTHFGGFGLTAPEKEGYSHIRIHPLLPWTETDVWEYTLRQELPVNPLYFAKEGRRFRSLGCEPCTEPIESRASTISEILSEVYQTPGLERAGRMQDKESKETMLTLRSLGYL